MRRDVYIENDSGGFSVLAVDAVDAIIEDQRSDDFRFVKEHKAMLLELYGDDSMVVRIVLDEPLRPEEEAQWLARSTWEIETTDGNMLVMGGFDPDVLSWWKDDHDGEGDGRGIGAVSAAPGRWRVDIYAHAGSMNGRAILSESDERPGAAFRRSHPGKAFPLWLAKMLEHSGEDDPGFEEPWNNIKRSMAAGQLEIDIEGGDAVGFLVHFTRAQAPAGDPPDEIWFGRADHSRIPKVFPLGLVAEVADLNLRYFHDDILEIKRPEPAQPVADGHIEIIATWPGETLRPIAGGAVALPIAELHLLHWIAGLTTDTTPRFEILITPKGPWTPPAATADFAVMNRGAMIAIGPVKNTGGWHTWWTSRAVAQALSAIPDGAMIDLAMMPDASEREDQNSTAGMARYSGTARGGAWQIEEASPIVSQKALSAALHFIRDLLINNKMQVRKGEERKGFNAAAEMFVLEMDSLKWQGDIVSLAEPDERMHLLLAPPVFRVRFADTWPVDAEEELDDDD